MALTYPAMVWGGVLVQFLALLIFAEIWKSVYQAMDTTTAPLNLQQVLIYLTLSILIGAITGNSILDQIQGKCVSGDVAYHLIRPLNFKLYTYAESFGLNFGKILIQMPVILFVGIVFFSFQPPSSFNAIPFCISLILSILLIYQIYYTLGLIAFWFQNISYIPTVVGGLFLVFGGNGIPLAFFPKAFNDLASLMPFKFTYYACISIYISDYEDQLANFALIFGQISWILVLNVVEKVMWKTAVKKLEVNGG